MRKYRSLTDDGKSFINIPTPTLTLAGELDGMTRISRIAEAFYHQYDNLDTRVNTTDLLPIVVLKGVSHMQFSSGDAPQTVKKYDLKPEASQEEANHLISTYVGDFLNGVETNTEMKLIKSSQQETESYLRPIINALEMERSYHLKPPCYASSMINPTSDSCLKGRKFFFFVYPNEGNYSIIYYKQDLLGLSTLKR
jgi:hypothetical protein